MVKIDVVRGTLIRTNNYIVMNGNSVVLIEASAELKDIKSKILGKNVVAILLTHGHWDHFINLNKYLQEFKCKVYMTEEAYKKITTKERLFKIDRNPGLNIPMKNVNFIKDGDSIKFGDGFNFNVIETKGHTNCSVCFLLNDEILFSGDTLFEKDRGRWDLPTGNFEELEKSLCKLLSFDENIVVYPGHGDLTTIKNELANFN